MAKFPQASEVTRTYRTAIRLGEDFITVEETVTLPVDASDDEVQRAVDLGWRIYQAQREAVEQQVAVAREGRPSAPAPMQIREPGAPASDKQRNYLARLQGDLGWTNEELAAEAATHGIDLVTMSKAEASSFIDLLKRMVDGFATSAPAPTTPTRPASRAAAPPQDVPLPEDPGEDIPF